LQSIVELAAQAITTDMLAEYTHGNALALQQLVDDPTVAVRPFPDEVLRVLKRHTEDIVAQQSAADEMWKKIAASYYAFIDKSTASQRVTEVANLATRSL
jgi:TRAP-type mannitol/chloroaromatic compound transport system substrate-binding protein